MTDCSNVTMREMLPDLVNDRLPADARAQVQAHVDSCADCRAELELLRRVQAVAPTPNIDTARIVAAIAPYQRPSLIVIAARSWTVRAAAAVILVVGATTLLRTNDGGLDQPDSSLALAPTDLSVGALSDIPDQDLRSLMTDLRKIQAVTPVEPDVVVPSVGRGSGGGQ